MSSQAPSAQISILRQVVSGEKALDPNKRRFSFRIRLKHVASGDAGKSVDVRIRRVEVLSAIIRACSSSE